MTLNERALIGVATATVASCAPTKNEYASYELYPVRSGAHNVKFVTSGVYSISVRLPERTGYNS